MSAAIAQLYPTSPLQTFPPPLPAGRTPLRVRCGVTMRLHLSTHVLAAAPAWPSPKGHIQPHRNHLPRRRNPRRIVFHDDDEEKAAEAPKVEEKEPEQKVDGVKADAEVEAEANGGAETEVKEEGITEDPYALPPQVEHPHLQEFIPGLNISFIGGDDETPDSLPGQSSSAPYTHIVSMHFGAEAKPIERSYEGRCQRLRLSLGERDASAARLGLGLTDAQLRVARDFIAEAQPRLSASEGMQHGVRVLIATPQGCPTNAMCVLACYLAFVTSKGVEETLTWIDQDEEFLSVWKGEVSEDEAERVEKIARAWSYLSQIIRPSHSI